MKHKAKEEDANTRKKKDLRSANLIKTDGN